jgi:sugar phosphate isomerase/epimerase
MTPTPDGLPKLGITLFSLTLEMRRPDYSLEGMIRRVAELDLGPGLELVGFQSIRNWPNLDGEFVREFRDLVEGCELVQTAMSMNLDLARRRDRRMTEDEALAYLEAQMEAAKRLGFPIGKSAILSTRSFVEGLARITERLDMKFGVEVHSPESVDSPHVAELRELFDAVGSPRLGFVPDFSSSMHDVPPSLVAAHRASGMSQQLIDLVSEVWHSDSSMPEKFGRFAEEANALGASPGDRGKLNMVLTMHGRMDPQRWQELMPQVIHVHGKFYGIDEDGNEPSIDHETIMDVFVQSGYTGYISSEWEGHAYTDAMDGYAVCRAQQDLMRRLLLKAAETHGVAHAH